MRFGRAGRRRSVSRVLSRARVTPDAEAIIPLGRRLPAASSSLPASSGEQPYTHEDGYRPRETPAYAALLPMGFAVPPALPRARWALTPPFHPYRWALRESKEPRAVSFLLHSPQHCRHRALPGIVLCGARTFLPPRRSATGDRPSGVDAVNLHRARRDRNWSSARRRRGGQGRARIRRTRAIAR